MKISTISRARDYLLASGWSLISEEHPWSGVYRPAYGKQSFDKALDIELALRCKLTELGV